LGCYVVDVLRGSKNAKILDRGHDKLSVYGAGSDHAKTYWNSVIRQLINLNYILIKNWEYRSLGLADKSIRILRNEDTLMLRKQKVKGTLKQRTKKAIQTSHGENELFEELRKLRRSLASEKNIPPYLVFSDKSLHDMCLLKPKNRSEFLLVNGVGQNKCEKYGSEFLHIISGYLS